MTKQQNVEKIWSPPKNVMYLNDTKIDDGLGMQDSSKFAKKRL